MWLARSPRVEVSFGLRKGELVGNVRESRDDHPRHADRANVVTIVIDDRQPLSDVLELLVFILVFRQLSSRGALVAVDHQVDEPPPHLPGCAELDRPESADDRERHVLHNSDKGSGRALERCLLPAHSNCSGDVS